MKAIAKKYSSEKQDFHVAVFTSRPVLKVKEKGTDKSPMTFTFIDSVLRYGRGMVEADLGDAYRRAGKAFQGQLQQNFVVLRDRESYPEVVAEGASTLRKRQREKEARGQEQNRGSKGGRVVRERRDRK